MFEIVMEEGTDGGGWKRGLALTSLSRSLIQFGHQSVESRCRWGWPYFLTATCDSNYRFPFKLAFVLVADLSVWVEQLYLIVLQLELNQSLSA